jgi:integrase
MLTDVKVRKTAPTDKRQEIPDGHTRGLYLIVQPSGKKSWACRYSRKGRVLKVTLGPCPALSLAEARRQAAQIMTDVAKGADPAADKRAEKAIAPAATVRTVRPIAEEFLKRHTDEKAGVRWASETRRILDHDVLPAIGDKAATSVGKAEIHDILDAITDRGAPIAANRALAVLRKLYRWALSRGYVDRDPCEGVAKPGDETKRDRVLTADELVRVWCAAEAMPYPFGPALRMLILTGARREEVGAMRWSEVDLAEKIWTIPGVRTKNGVEHVIPLSDAATSILARAPRIGKRDGFVFTTTGETPVSGWSKAKTKLDAAILEATRERDDKAQPICGWRLHDLRRTVATGLAGLGVALPVVEKILNHVSGSFGGVAGVYQRFACVDEKREALDKWAARVAAIVGSEGDGDQVQTR